MGGENDTWVEKVYVCVCANLYRTLCAYVCTHSHVLHASCIGLHQICQHIIKGIINWSAMPAY